MNQLGSDKKECSQEKGYKAQFWVKYNIPPSNRSPFYFLIVLKYLSFTSFQAKTIILTQFSVADEPEDVIHPHRLPGESESTNRAPIEAEYETDNEYKDQDSTAESENERNSSMTSQEKNAMNCY